LRYAATCRFSCRFFAQSQARSRYADFFYLGSPQPTNYILNGAVLVTCKTIRSVCASAAEAERAETFHSAQHTIVIKCIHKQSPIPLKLDNCTANSFIYVIIKQRKSKTWDMHFNWLGDRSFKKDEKSLAAILFCSITCKK